MQGESFYFHLAEMHQWTEVVKIVKTSTPVEFARYGNYLGK